MAPPSTNVQPTDPDGFRCYRVTHEIPLAAQLFADQGGVYYNSATCTGFGIPKYRLPDRWEDRVAELWVQIPTDYPFSPPIGAYVNKSIRLKNGGAEHLVGFGAHGARDFQAGGWKWYCAYLQEGTWIPSSDYREPDNLLSFMLAVHEALSRG